MTDAPVVPYPQYCHRLAPTYNRWCLLNATTIQSLKHYMQYQGQYRYFYRNLPISWVRVVGIIVAVDEYYGRGVFTVDDGSGACIECNATKVKDKDQGDNKKGQTTASASGTNAVADAPTTAKANAINTLEPRRKPTFKEPGCNDLDVGAVVDVKGEVDEFRGEKTIRIVKVRTLGSTELEVALWERRTAFQRDVLGEPWVLAEEQVKRCRREEEGRLRDERGREKDEERKRKKEEMKRQEAEVDGFGRPKVQKAKQREKTSDDAGDLDGFGRHGVKALLDKSGKKRRGHGEVGIDHGEARKVDGLQDDRRNWADKGTKGNTEEPDGFGRPKVKRSKKSDDRPGYVEGLDGFGRLKVRPRLEGTNKREKSIEEAGRLHGLEIERSQRPRVSGKENKQSGQRIDGFGRSRPQVARVSKRIAAVGEELDGFGRAKFKKTENRGKNGEGEGTEVELDGFGRPKNKKIHRGPSSNSQVLE